MVYNVDHAKEASTVDEICAGSVSVAEEWRPVVGWEGWYSVSSMGRVRSEPRTIIRRDGVVTELNGKLLADRVSTKGYIVAALTRKGRAAYRPVHQLVVEAFIGPIPDGLQVNHKSGIKRDNRLENLETVTPRENVAHAYRLGLARRGRVYGEDSGTAKLTGEQVLEIRSRYAAGGVRQIDLADEFGIGRATIGKIVRGERWRHILPVTGPWPCATNFAHAT